MSAEIYRKFEGMILKTVRDASERFPAVCQDDLLCEANVIFLDAVESFDDSQATLSTWLFRNLSLKLLNFSRRAVHLQKKFGGELQDTPASREFDTEEYLGKFGKDAQKVVTIALTAPEDLSRGLLREVLKDMGWAELRILACFKEIRSIL